MAFKDKRNVPRGPKVDMSSTLITHPIFLCLACLVGFCFLVTVLLVEMPQHSNSGVLTDVLGARQKIMKMTPGVAKSVMRDNGGNGVGHHPPGQEDPADNAIEHHKSSEKDHSEAQEQQHESNKRDMEQPDNELVKPAEHNPVPENPNVEIEIPYLPVFTPIPNHEQQKADTLAGKPTIAGIAACIRDFLDALHASNKKHSQEKAEFSVIIKQYFDLATTYLKPLEDAYHGQPIFPVRDDGSIFISLAAFREHLLAQTLRSAFSEAEYPEKIFVGIIVQNCFGLDGYQCRTGMQVIGKDEHGHDKAKISDAPPDVNGIEEFCNDRKFKKYCLNNQVRVIYQHETDALGPAVARYYASKLWAGETYFMQMDSHLEFANHWDTFYIKEVKLAKSYPNAVLSTYPPGFGTFGDYEGGTKGHRLCYCEFSTNEVERHIIRINTSGAYKGGEPRPTQIAYIAAGFFFAHAHFLRDVPFDPYLPWCFMGEEIALSMRAWTAGWDIYAPRTNMIAHQYRPGRMGLPKFWESVVRYCLDLCVCVIFGYIPSTESVSPPLIYSRSHSFPGSPSIY